MTSLAASEFMPEVTVVIPTFRERDNLAILLPRLFRVLRKHALTGEVIVVDDNSRDGTDQLCDQLAAGNPLRLLIRRDERGLATAVVHGLRLAHGEICVVMDADLSHPPEFVPALVEAARSPACEMAIGSRYMHGSSIDPNWSLFRRLNSKIALLLARGLTPSSDPMSGFFAIAKSTLERADNLRPLGYKIALELIVRCECRAIAEIPIAFEDRENGESKLSAHQQLLYLRHLARLYSVRYLAAPLTKWSRRESPTIQPIDRRAA